MKHQNLLFLYLIIFSILGCEGPEGKIGPDGKNSLVNIVEEPLGSNCANGGLKIETGIDKDANNLLSPDEISQTKYICKSDNGKSSLINVYSEPKGTTCANGGIKIEFGVDNNRNNILDGNEVTQTKFICNGIDGIPSLTIVVEELPGVNCLGGGKKTQVGLDQNGNFELDSDEIELTKYECYSQVIEYPATGLYGESILFKDKTNFLPYTEYSFTAKVPKNGKLKIVIKLKVSGEVNTAYWWWRENINWVVSDFDLTNNIQSFTSIHSDSNCDMIISFDKGEFIIEYYEFDMTTPTFTKTITVN